MASIETIDEYAAGRTLLFRVGATLYGCDIRAVREIVPFRHATRLPGAPPYVQGLINLRGTIVTVLDLGARLEPGRPPANDGSIIMIEHTGVSRTIGVVVEEVMDVRVLGADEGRGASESPEGIVRGVGHVDGAAIILLDIDALVKQVLLS